MFKFLVIVSTTVLSTVLSHPFNACIGKCPESKNLCENPTLLAHQDCTKYCFCNNGCPTIKTCPGNFHFNLDERMCLPVELAKCDDRRNCLGMCPIFYNTHNVLLLPHSNSSKFCHCREWGVPTVETCPESLVFNSMYGQCVKPNPDCHHGETVRSTGVVVPPTIPPIFLIDPNGPVYFPKFWPTSTSANTVSEDGTTAAVSENDVTTVPPTIPPILPFDLDGPVYLPEFWPTSTSANTVSEDGTTASVSENDVTTVPPTIPPILPIDLNGPVYLPELWPTSTSAKTVSEDGTTAAVSENDVTTVPPTIPPILPFDLDGPVHLPEFWPTSTSANSVSEDGTTAAVNENDATTIPSTGGCHHVNNKDETTGSAEEQTTVAGNDAVTNEPNIEDLTTIASNIDDATTTEAKNEGSSTVSSSQNNGVPDSENLVTDAPNDNDSTTLKSKIDVIIPTVASTSQTNEVETTAAPKIEDSTTVKSEIDVAIPTVASTSESHEVEITAAPKIEDPTTSNGPKISIVPCNCTQTVFDNKNPPIIKEQVYINDYFLSNVKHCIGQCPLENDISYTTHLPHLVCAQYCKCDWGKPTVMRCPHNLHFNRELQVCDYPINANCPGIGALTNF